MTPEELIVFFSAHVFTFILVWFTRVAESGQILTAEAPGGKKRAQEHLLVDTSSKGHDTAAKELPWNVATFFGLNRPKK